MFVAPVRSRRFFFFFHLFSFSACCGISPPLLLLQVVKWRREKAPRHSLIKERSRRDVNCRLFFRRNSSRLDRTLSFPDRGEEEMGEENNFSFLWETIKRPQAEWSSGRMRTPDHPRLRQIKLSIWEERGRRRRGNRLMTTPLSPFSFAAVGEDLLFRERRLGYGFRQTLESESGFRHEKPRCTFRKKHT